MKFLYQDKTFRSKSLKLIAICNDILTQFRAKGYELTLRQLYYQLVARAIIENNERSYDNIGALISDARLAGFVDWNAIVDRTRNLRALPHWNDPSEIVAASAAQFNYDKWEGQPTRVEVWVEKDALVDVVGQAASAYDVPFFSCRGYTSQSEMWGAAQRIIDYYENKDATTVVILHLGDHDPSGLDMSRDIEDRLTMFCEAHGHPAPIIKRIALNMDQVRKYNPPPNPAKLTDCRVHKYIAAHGHESWELDALDPDVINRLIVTNIKSLMDEALYDEQAARQEQARAELSQISENYGNILSGQKELENIHAELEKANVSTVTELASTVAAIHTALGEDPASTNDGLAETVSELKQTAIERSNLLDKVTREITELKKKLAKQAAKKRKK